MAWGLYRTFSVPLQFLLLYRSSSGHWLCGDIYRPCTHIHTLQWLLIVDEWLIVFFFFKRSDINCSGLLFFVVLLLLEHAALPCYFSHAEAQSWCQLARQLWVLSAGCVKYNKVQFIEHRRSASQDSDKGRRWTETGRKQRREGEIKRTHARVHTHTHIHTVGDICRVAATAEYCSRGERSH